MISRIAFLRIAFVLTTHFSQAQISELKKTDSAVISLNEMNWNVGYIKQGESVTHEFHFKNTGNKPLVISEVEKECGCTSVHWTTEPIAPNSEGIIYATIQINQGSGEFDKKLSVYSNSTILPITLSLKGTLMNVRFEVAPSDTLK